MNRISIYVIFTTFGGALPLRIDNETKANCKIHYKVI